MTGSDQAQPAETGRRFNPSFPNDAHRGAGWTSSHHFGINPGPVVLTCEHSSSDMLWRLMRAFPHVVPGLRRAGLRGRLAMSARMRRRRGLIRSYQ